ncbi:MAG: DUF3160 domain-containing protein [Labilithrix sp.]|nr:DUF3160 domain-containing protein [Labilithrix sp.]
MRAEIALPRADGEIAKLEGAARLWDELDLEARASLRRDGVLSIGSGTVLAKRMADHAGPGRSIGAFYTHLREQRIPHVVTIDALFALVHLGLVRALGHVEEVALAPALDTFLQRIEARLGAEKTGAKTELADAYRVARGVIGVARALSATAPYAAPADLAKVIAEERALVEAHGGSARSPLLGVTLDYARFAAPSTAARPGAFRALAWLAAAPLTLVARSEAPGGTASLHGARTNARAAMLLARLCSRDVDPAIHDAYTRATRLLAFVWGGADDLGLGEIDEIAGAAGVDLRTIADVSNVVRVDRVRARAVAGRAPLLFDGTGLVGRHPGSADGVPVGPVNVRVFGGHAAADSLVLQALVGAPVGLARDAAAASEVDRLRGGYRVLPSTLDLAAWLGAPEARSLLRETNADAFDAYDATLSSLRRSRLALEESAALHASVHGSLVDALIAWANAEPEAGVARTAAADRMRVESLLASWTLVRHVGQAMARARPAPPSPAAVLRVTGAALPTFVEPLPDVVSRLVSVVRQARRGLEALGGAAPPSSAAATLTEIEDILRGALKGAERHAGDEPLSAEEAATLASLPARIAKLEDDSPEPVGPAIAVVYSDAPSRRLLATATGPIEPALMLARDPARDEPVLVVGAHLTHHEVVAGLEAPPGVLHAVRPNLTDAAWQARWSPPARTAPAGSAASAGVPEAGAPRRPAWTASFRWTR